MGGVTAWEMSRVKRMERAGLIWLILLMFLVHPEGSHAWETVTPSVDCLTVRSDQILIGHVIKSREDVRIEDSYCPGVVEIQARE